MANEPVLDAVGALLLGLGCFWAGVLMTAYGLYRVAGRVGRVFEDELEDSDDAA